MNRSWGSVIVPGLAHVPAGILPAAFRNVSDDWRDERLAEPARDLVRRIFHDELVFAIDHVRALLLGARRADDRRRPSGCDEIAYLSPCQVFDEHAVGRLPRWRRLRRVSRPLREQKRCEDDHDKH